MGFTIFIISTGVLVWIGIQYQPKPFPPQHDEKRSIKTVPLPAGLPDPVQRFYSAVYGKEIPVIETAVISGRGTLKPFLNLPIPARFFFVHNAGKAYRHYFEATIFGMPVFKVNEGYLHGMSFFESPMASFTNDPNSNQAANLTLWAEAIWFPAIWVTDPRVHWEPVDDDTALLFVPFDQREENFLVRFNPVTDLIDIMEAMRYRETGDDQITILWILRSESKQPVAEGNAGATGSAMWLDQGSPWASFDAEQIFLNVDVSQSIHR